MSNLTTKYLVNNSNGTGDLTTIFQINPNNTIIDKPFTISSGNANITYESGFYILNFLNNSVITLSNNITSEIYFICVGGGGGGSGGTPSSTDKIPGSGGNGGGFVNGYFKQTDSNGIFNIIVGAGGSGGSYEAVGNAGLDSSIKSTDNSINIVAKGGNGGVLFYPPAGQPANIVSSNINKITNSPEGIVSGNHANIYISGSIKIYNSTCGLNGFSTRIPPNSNNICYYAGGGASGGYFQGGTFAYVNNITGGLGGGGNGQYSSGTGDNYPINTPNTNGIDYTGGGGGGGTVPLNSSVTTARGGNGGIGNVTLYFKYP